MRISNKPYLLFLCLFLFTSSFALQADSRRERNLLEPLPVFETSPAFKALLKMNPGTSSFEIQKIDYLLGRMTNSTCAFIRNGEEHSGAIAALHMRWKYARYKNEVKTAEDFPKKIANASRKTRERYKIRLKNGNIHYADEILLNELEELNTALKKAATKK